MKTTSFQSWLLPLCFLQGLLVNLTYGSTKEDFALRNFDGRFAEEEESRIVKTVLEGERKVTLDCSISDEHHINIQFRWSLNDKLIHNSTRRFQVGSNLFISRVDREADDGDFRCIATSTTSGFIRRSPAVKLNIIWISPLAEVELSSPKTLSEIRKDEEIILKCKVEGTSQVRFKWFRNGEEIISSDAVIIRDQRLHILKLSLEDYGSYGCVAWNEAGRAEAESKFHLYLEDEKVPRLISPPHDQIVKLNSAATFHCVFEKNAQTQWYFRDNGPLNNSSKYSIHQNGSLTIQQVQKLDEGTYKCLGNFPGEEPVRYDADLKSSYLHPLNRSSLEPTPLVPGPALAFPENSMVEIFCRRPQGRPHPKMWWEDSDGRVIPNFSNLTLANVQNSVSTRNFNTLVIGTMNQEASGSYSCWAENSEGISTTSLQLSVATPPIIFGHPLSTVALEGESVIFVCQFEGSGFPISRVHWFRNHLPITQEVKRASFTDNEYTENSRLWNHEHNSTLIINPVHLSDIGEYSCEVNTPGFPTVRSEPAQLNVKESLKFSPKPMDRKLELGSSSKIHCKAHGASTPVVRWIKDRLDGQPTIAWPDHIQDQNGTLYFQEVQSSDKGLYTCIAKNAEGFINTTIYVDVIVSPKFLVIPSNPTEAMEGFALMMHCKAGGDPVPTISWARSFGERWENFEKMSTKFVIRDEEINRFHILDNGSLLITRVLQDDEGNYACTAGNSGGLRREEVQLIVKRAGNVMTKTVSITLSVAAGYMLLVIFLVLWCRYRQLKRKQEYLNELRGEDGDAELKDIMSTTTRKCNGNSNGTLLRMNGLKIADSSSTKEVKDKSDGEVSKSPHSFNGGGKAASATASVASHKSQQSQTSSAASGYSRIVSTRSDLQFVMLLGHGNFGEVFLAKAKNVKEDENESMVMVKSLQTRDEFYLSEFKRELDMYYKLNHENISRLVRLCREMDPHYMIVEYSDWGDLKQFLLATRKDHPRVPKAPKLTMFQIIGIIKQVALGMEHLANHRFVHKDLAARNCLISSGLRIQISNPCLTKDAYANEYYMFRNQVLPIRWLPFEAVMEDDFSTKSDVFSFAVLVWEVLQQAAMPFSNLSNEAVLESLGKKQLCWNLCEMEECVPENIRSLLLQCWDISPRNRPSFNSIVTTIDAIAHDGLET